MKYSKIPEMKRELREASTDKLVVLKILVKNILYILSRLMLLAGIVMILVGAFLLSIKIILIGLAIVVLFIVLRINLFFGRILPYKSEFEINEVLKNHITRNEIYNVFENNMDIVNDEIHNMIKTNNINILVKVTDEFVYENVLITESINIKMLKNKLIALACNYFNFDFKSYAINTYVGMVFLELIEKQIKHVIVKEDLSQELITKKLLTATFTEATNNPFINYISNDDKEFINYAKEILKRN